MSAVQEFAAIFHAYHETDYISTSFSFSGGRYSKGFMGLQGRLSKEKAHNNEV